jgi:hypothetical protein
MNKKAQGISINVIIIAVVALLVLVLLSLIFTGKMAQITKAMNSCEELDYASCLNECPSGYTEDLTRRCYIGTEIDTTQDCCIPVQER